jgi:hypothetical protein
MEYSTGYRIFLFFVVVGYLFYAMFGIGATGLFFSLAIALISFSMDFSNELTIAFLILSGLLWKFIVLGNKEGFKTHSQASTGTGDSLQAIVKKIQQVEQRGSFQPTGVLSSTMTEGFADVEAPKPSDKKEEKPKAAESTPAPVTAPTVTPALKDAIPNPANKPATAGFTDKAMDGMFKLGSIPPDTAGGSHIDVGTTLMNAFNSLKPDQVKQMTEDSQKLMETQKNLMGMLGTLKPMLQDGKQLMETFQEMFGNQAVNLPKA